MKRKGKKKKSNSFVLWSIQDGIISCNASLHSVFSTTAALFFFLLFKDISIFPELFL